VVICHRSFHALRCACRRRRVVKTIAARQQPMIKKAIASGRLVTTWFPIFVIIFVSIFAFLPTFMNDEYEFPQDHKLIRGINSQRHLNIISIAIGTAIPMLIEILMDYKDFPLYVLLPRLLIVAGILIPNAILLFSNRTPTLFLNIFQSRSTLIAGGLLIALFDSGNSLPHQVTVVITTLSCAAFMITSTLGLDDSNIRMVSNGLYFLCLAEALLICLWYARRVIRDWSEVMKSTTRKTTLIHSILISVYACLPSIVNVSYGAKAWGETTSSELTVYTAIDICVAVIAISIPSRLVRQENYRVQV
jgi:hypothetical protein